MRPASRLLAAVKDAKFLEPFAPTGLTGLLTHPSPRSTLIYLYSSTLDKLQKMPESSVYRQATEALTRHRLAIVEAAKPAGYDRWQESIQLTVAENPHLFEQIKTSTGTRIRFKKTKQDVDFRRKAAEWDGEKAPVLREGIRTFKERKSVINRMHGGSGYKAEDDLKDVKLAPEPPLTAEQ
jgi:NADH dehydrogenase (ubiquinone) 1 alpha subcomplex subunit 5